MATLKTKTGMRRSIGLKDIPQLTDRSAENGVRNMEKQPLVISQEELELARKIKNNDYESLKYLTRTNLEFVVAIAEEFEHQGITFSDLIKEGNMGFIIAAKRYDETKEFKFNSYAKWWVRQAIISAIKEQGKHNKQKAVENIADDNLMYESVKGEVNYALSLLNKRDRKILILFFGLGPNPPMSLEVIAELFDITNEQAESSKEKALQKLRNCSGASTLTRL
jgi:RNA polymerase sigma factor (sigma-70 family)